MMAGDNKPEMLDSQTLGNAETAPFWRGAADGRLLIKRCDDCSAHHWYPRVHCPHCGAGKTEWVEASGKGTIYSFTVMRRGGGQVPCYVTLDESVSIFTNIVDCDPDEIAIGQRVRVQFRKEKDGVMAPVFALDKHS